MDLSTYLSVVSLTVLWIRITLTRIRIRIITLMRIRIQIIASKKTQNPEKTLKYAHIPYILA
jgi:hypothetical protein